MREPGESDGLERLPDDLAAVARLGNDLPVRLLLENLSQALSHERVVVAQKDSQLAHVFLHTLILGCAQAGRTTAAGPVCGAEGGCTAAAPL